MQTVLNWFAQKWNDLVDFLWRLVLSVYDLLKDFLFWIIETLMGVAVYMLNGLSYLLDGLDVAQYFAFIPPETAYIMSITGFSEAMGMIIASIGIRFILQMIPFVRWGS